MENPTRIGIDPMKYPNNLAESTNVRCRWNGSRLCDSGIQKTSIVGTREKQRRGIALILVVTLIVIFFLLATTFVSMSTSFLRTSKRAVTRERVAIPDRSVLLDEVMLMLVRDVKSTAGNPIATHSILADLYGRQPTSSLDATPVYFSGPNTVTQVQASPVGGMGFVASRVEALTAANSGHNYQGKVFGIVADFANQLTVIQNQWSALTRDQMIGKYLTFTDGPTANQTVTIINFQHLGAGVPDPASAGNMNVSSGQIRIWVLVTEDNSPWLRATNQTVLPQFARFVVNGRPYAGGGVNSTFLGQLGINSPLNPSALDNANLPGDSGLDLSDSTTGFSDLFMATNQPGGTSTFQDSTGFETTLGRIVPSFHRFNGLGNKIRNGGFVTRGEVFNLRRVSPVLNPNFTGSNPFGRFLSRPGASGYDGHPDTQVVPFDITNPQHRIHLANYMMANQEPADPALRLPVLPNYSLLDVDNDGDGHVDSFWMDLGLSPITTASGKRLKPLVAVLIEDQGGKLNLNAHGSRTQLDANTVGVAGHQIPVGQGVGAAEIRINDALDNPQANFPFSQPLMTNFADFLRMKYGEDQAPGLRGSNPQLYMRQHGNFYEPVTNDGATHTDHLTGGLFGSVSDYAGQFVFAPVGTPIPHESLIPTPGFQIGAVDALIQKSPSLPFARTATGAVRSLLTDTPYTFNVAGSSSDNFQIQYGFGAADGTVVPFTGANWNNRDRSFDIEFHELWNRIHDNDFSEKAIGYVEQLRAAGNPAFDRFGAIFNSLVINSVRQRDSGGTTPPAIGAYDRFRRQFTTTSYSVPSIPVNIAAMFRKILVHHNAERATNNKIAFANVGTIGGGTIEREVANSLGPEIVAGLPFNLKPIFGNGVDDQPFNGIPDDEAIAGSALNSGDIESLRDQRVRGAANVNSSGTVVKSAGPAMDIDNDGVTPSGGDGNEALARHTYARRLYTLTLLLISDRDDLLLSTAALNSGSNNDILRLRVAVAQWAANVVDFQDPDNSMTVFEFDINPFDGWDVDGNAETIDLLADGSTPNPERNVVYGVERPDLLLSEAIGFHDTGCQDFEDSSDPNIREYRQSHIPYAPAFIELINPQIAPPNNSNEVRDVVVSSSRSDHVSNYGAATGIQLNKVNRVNEPVYRIMVVNSEIHTGTSTTSRGANPDRSISAFDNSFADPTIQPSTGVGGGGNISVLFNANDIDSMIYFADPRDLNTSMQSYSGLTGQYPVQLTIPSQQFFYRPADGAPAYQQNLVVLPGRTAVIGSGGAHDQSNWRTIFGRSPMDPVSPRPAAPTAMDDRPFHLELSDFGTAAAQVNPYVYHGRTTIQLVPGESVRIGQIQIQEQSGVTDLEMDQANDFDMTEIPYSVSVPLNRQIVNGSANSRDIYSVFSLTSPTPTHLANTSSSSNNPDGYLPAEARVMEKDGYRLSSPRTTLLRNQSSLEEPQQFGDFSNDANKHLVLQRLANPNLPFHPIANPFVTVDQLEMNFNAYAGKQTERNNLVSSNPWGTTAIGTQLIRSAQRGYLGDNDGDRNNFFAVENGEPNNPRTNSKNILRRTMLGRWKKDFSDTVWFERNQNAVGGRPPAATQVIGSFPSPNFYTSNEISSGVAPMGATALALSPLEIRNSFFVLNGMANASGTEIANRTVGTASQQLFANYTFDNSNSFDENSNLGELNYCYRNGAYAPWFRVPNRPLISAMELMEVPCQSNALLLEHIAFPRDTNSTTFDYYQSDLFSVMAGAGSGRFQLHQLAATGVGSTPGQPTDDIDQVGFGFNNDRIVSYMLNFLNEDGAPIGRLMDFVSTPDPYVGSYTYLDPNVFSGDQNALFNHPYNWIDNRRIPGRINVNRIFDREVYAALMGGDNSAYVRQLPFDNRNYTGSAFTEDASSNFASYDANQVQESFAAAFNSDQAHYIFDNGTPGNATDDYRGYAFRNTGTGERAEPLAEVSRLQTTGVNDVYDIDGLVDFDTKSTWFRKRRQQGEDHKPMFDFESSAAGYNTLQNPYFKNLMRMRLANMTTNKSSVFNIWITIGYFELEQTTFAEPDLTAMPGVDFVAGGVPPTVNVTRETIGREYGLDTGEVKRDRAFFVYDRSIPVGFVPGFDLNVRKGILLRRIIEEN